MSSNSEPLSGAQPPGAQTSTFVKPSSTIPQTSSTVPNPSNKLNPQDRANIYDFLVSLNKNKNRKSSISILLQEDDLKMKHIIMYKYLIIDSFNSKDYDTVNNCYGKLSALLLKNSPINRYIYALIVYIDVEVKFYSIQNKFSINISKMNKVFKNKLYSFYDVLPPYPPYPPPPVPSHP